jgi:NAD(P)-dependent dehydrogenase (short-subunit alcohol dehydrogenase family)
MSGFRSRFPDSPDEIARVVRFLVDADSSYLNGTVIVANGGEPSALPA